MRAASALLLVLAACTGSDNEFKQVDDTDVGNPLMVVEPDRLDFGGHVQGEDAVQTFEIRNEGEVSLSVSSIRIEGSSSFTLLSASSMIIPPDDVATVQVAYTPSTRGESARVRVDGNDSANPTEWVDIVGTLLMPSLQVTPDPIAFGAMPVLCYGKQTVNLANVGDAPLIIDSIVQTGPESLYMVQPNVLPVTLDPGASTDVEVWFNPREVAPVEGGLYVTSNDPTGLSETPILGEGSEGDSCDQYVLPGDWRSRLDLTFYTRIPAADISFLLDTTCSMGGVISAMSREYGEIANTIESTAVADATYGVVTFDDYAMSPYGSAGTDLPFQMRQQQTSDLALVQGALSSEVVLHSGGDGPESNLEALFQAATGTGYDQDCDGNYDVRTDVPPFISGAGGDPFSGSSTQAHDPATPGTGELGGMGYREGVLPIILYTGDNPLRDSENPMFTTPGGCPADASMTDVANAINSLGGKTIGIAINTSTGYMVTQMQALGAATNSYGDLDGDGSLEPIVVSWNGSGEFQETVVSGILQLLAANYEYDRVWLEVEGDTDHIVESITPSMMTNVPAGRPVTFSITFYVPEVPELPDSHTLTFVLYGDEGEGPERLDSRTLEIIVPGATISL